MHAVSFVPSDVDLSGGARRTVSLVGRDGGKYPYGNTLLVRGTEEALLIDPSLSMSERGGAPVGIDRLLVSHSHEDHLAGAHQFPGASIHAHRDDLLGLQSLDGFMEVYGMPAAIEEQWRPQVIEQFHYAARADASGFEDGERFELGGVSVEVVHLPGHTRGHCGFLIEPDGVFFVADIDLSSFGPYYGDHWSDLDDFERSIARCRDIEARYYATFHHKGVVEGRAAFVEALDRFAAVIGHRDRALLAFLDTFLTAEHHPATLDDIAAHGFIYRKGADVLWAGHVERTSMTMHVARLLRHGAIHEPEPGRFAVA